MSFDPVDPLDLEASLTEEERLVRDTTRAFVADRLEPEVRRWFEDGAVPAWVAPELGALGVLGMHLTGYGCAGAGPVSYGLACMELEACDSGLRSFVSVQGSLAMYPIWRYGSEDQKRRWLPAMAAGEAIGCFGLTEPDHGSDPASMSTRAKRAGSGFVISGTKTWITNGHIADVAVVWARTDEGVRGFLVERGGGGFAGRAIGGKLSMRASATSELVLDGVEVPETSMLPGARGIGSALSCLNEARYGISWGVMGAARSCYQAALEYSKSREQFGKPIAAFQLTQQKLVEMMLGLSKGTLLALHIGRAKQAGRLLPEQVSMAKLDNVRAALAVCRSARTVLGANGITIDYPVMRHAANLESVLTYEGTPEVHTLALGQAITGHP
ncbi:MAG: acyl-CoA dehydrogenase family protein, partial [Acidimicrobiales bacterium]